MFDNRKYDSILKNVNVDEIGYMMIKEQKQERLPVHYAIVLDKEQIAREKRIYCVIKRTQDIVLSLLALTILFVPMIILAVIICIDSPGASPLFCQRRVGLNGKEFTMLKFRTMIPHAEEKREVLLLQNDMNGPVFKIKNDPRITRVGRIIRKIGVDELPQLWNILVGQMSIVGPRPALPREVAKYDQFEQQRLFVKPGLTCYWQVQPQRNDLSFEQWVNLDIRYILDRGYITDWKIIFRTIGAVIRADGA